jgi:hypothetical protein
LVTLSLFWQDEVLLFLNQLASYQTVSKLLGAAGLIPAPSRDAGQDAAILIPNHRLIEKAE